MNEHDEEARASLARDAAKYFPGRPVALVNYIVHRSARRKVLYVETAKVACTSIKLMLQLAEVDGDRERLPQKVHERKTSPIVRLSDGGPTLAEAIADPAYFKFCFVRNPFTRTLSAYLDKMVTNAHEKNRLAPKLGLDPASEISMRAYLEALTQGDNVYADIHWCPQTFLLSASLIPYDYIGRFEGVEQGLAAVAVRIAPELGDDMTEIDGRVHRTGSEDLVAKHIGPGERDLILRLYRDDFRSFAYGRGLEFATR